MLNNMERVRPQRNIHGSGYHTIFIFHTEILWCIRLKNQLSELLQAEPFLETEKSSAYTFHSFMHYNSDSIGILENSYYTSNFVKHLEQNIPNWQVFNA